MAQITLSTEMDDHARKAMEQRRAGRKKATIKGYRKGLACWAAFYERHHFTDKDLLFLKEEIPTMQAPMKKVRGTSKATGNGSSYTACDTTNAALDTRDN